MNATCYTFNICPFRHQFYSSIPECRLDSLSREHETCFSVTHHMSARSFLLNYCRKGRVGL